MTDYTIGATKVRPLPGCITSLVQTAEAMAIGKVVQVNASSKIVMADASASATATGQLGLVVAGANNSASGSLISGETATVVWFGRVAIEDASLDPTKHVYVSDTTGALADAGGTYIRRFGSAESDKILFINAATVTSAS